MKIFEKIKAFFTGSKKECCVVEKPEVDQITERLIDVSTKPLALVEEVKPEPSVKEIKSKTKKVVAKPVEEVKPVEKPKVAKKTTKKPKN